MEATVKYTAKTILVTDGEGFIGSKFIANFLNGNPLSIYDDSQGICDWLHVDDCNCDIEFKIRDGQIDNTYNVGGNNEWTNIDCVTLVCNLMDQHRLEGSPCANLITYVKGPAGHDHVYVIYAAKLMPEVGCRPEEIFETSIRKTIQWCLDNTSWERSVMDATDKG